MYINFETFIINRFSCGSHKQTFPFININNLLLFFILGGLVGTVAAYAIAPDYKSFLQVIHELDHIKQRKLFDTIQNAVSSLDIIDVAKFAIVLATSQSIKQIVIREAINFISNELHMQITEN